MPLDPAAVAAAVKQAKDGLAKLTEADAEIRKAEMAGVDVTGQKARAAEMRKQVNQFLAVYGR